MKKVCLIRRPVITMVMMAMVIMSSCVNPNGSGPGPGPGPAPVPVVDDDKVETLWVATVDDYAKRDSGSILVLNTLAAGISPHKFREYDVENPEWRQKYSKYVDAAGGPPCAFFLDFKTKNPVGKSIPLPKTWDDLKKEINNRTTRPI